MSPKIRAEALKSMAAYVGAGVVVLGLAKLAGADVETDPRSSDFGKIRIGKTRIDVWGGFQPYARAAAQLWTGESKSPTTGKISKKDAGDVLKKLAESKLAPLPALAYHYKRGKGFNEKPFDPAAELWSLITPMSPGATYDTIQEHGPVKGALLGAPDFLGAGVQTFH